MEIVVAGDCIFYVKELLPKDLCRPVIENYQRDARRHPGSTIGSRGEKKSHDDVKVRTDLGIDKEGVWTASNGILTRSGLQPIQPKCSGQASSPEDRQRPHFDTLTWQHP